MVAPNETQHQNRSVEPAAGSSHWAAQLGWLLAAAYLIGLASRKSREAFWGYPSISSSDLVDASNAIYGGLMLALVGVSILGYLAIDVRQPYTEARNWWERKLALRVADGRERSSAFGVFMLARRWFATALVYILPYYVALGLLALTAAGGQARSAFYLFFFLTVVSLSTWRRGHLETTGRVLPEKHIAAPNLATILSISSSERPAFSRIYSVLLLSLITGVWFYPDASASVGGGRPTSVIVTLHASGDSSQRDADSTRSDTLYLTGERGDYFAFRVRADDPKSVRFIAKQSINEMRLLAPK